MKIGILWMVLAATLLAAGPLDEIEKQVLRFKGATQESSWSCSAVVIAPGYAVTAGHCVDEQNADFTIADHAAKVEKKNRIIDLAVVSFKSAGEIVLPLALNTPATGSSLAVAGYAEGMPDLYMHFGYVSRTKDPNGYLVLNIEAFHGDSGGAVIDKRGRLVGLVTAKMSDGGSTLTYALPVEKLREFAEDYLPKEKK